MCLLKFLPKGLEHSYSQNPWTKRKQNAINNEVAIIGSKLVFLIKKVERKGFFDISQRPCVKIRFRENLGKRTSKIFIDDYNRNVSWKHKQG